MLVFSRNKGSSIHFAVDDGIILTVLDVDQKSGTTKIGIKTQSNNQQQKIEHCKFITKDRSG